MPIHHEKPPVMGNDSHINEVSLGRGRFDDRKVGMRVVSTCPGCLQHHPELPAASLNCIRLTCEQVCEGLCCC